MIDSTNEYTYSAKGGLLFCFIEENALKYLKFLIFRALSNTKIVFY